VGARTALLWWSVIGATALLILAPTAAASSAYSGRVAGTPGLEAYWRLGETTGTNAVSVTGTNPGIYLGSPLLGQPGAIVDDTNGAVGLSSLLHRISVPDSSSLDLQDGPLTLEAWIKRSQVGTGFEAIISKGENAYGLFLLDNRVVLRKAGVPDGDIARSYISIIDTTTWHHVVATKNSLGARIYVDGADTTLTPIANKVLADNGSPLQIGLTGTNFPFRGSVDEVAIYRNVLEPSEVEAHQRIGTTPNTGRESQLTRYPYLTDVVENYATVSWATDQSSGDSAVVKWGRVGTESCTAPPNSVEATSTPIVVDNTPQYQWQANLTLSPDTEYCYRVYIGAEQLDLLGTDQTPRFRTQLRAGSTQAFSFGILGDWGDTRAAPDQANVMRLLARSGVRFTVTTGDNSYPDGTQSDYGDLDHPAALTQPPQNPGMSGVFGARNWAQVGASMPIFPTIGNHDIHETLTPGSSVGTCTASPTDPGTSTYLINWPQDRAVTNSQGLYCLKQYPSVNGTAVDDYPTAYYAFDAGNARFYILNTNWFFGNRGAGDEYRNDHASNWTPTSEQYKWLENDLKAHPDTPIKFAFFHYPLYSDDHNEPSDTYLQGADSLAGLLARNGVQIAFSGHAHSYQRNHPDPNGLLSYTTGTSGAIALTVGGPTGNSCSAIDAYAIGWDTYAQSGPPNTGDRCGAAPVPLTPAQVYHYLKVTVDGKKVTVTPIDSLGQTFDVQTYDFGPKPPGCPPACPPAGASGVPPSPDSKPVADKSAPVQVLTGSKTQDIDKLTVTVRVNEAGTVNVAGSVNVPGASKVYRFKSVKRSVGANKPTKIRLKLASKSLRPVKRALKRKKRLKARITVTARDAAANASKKQTTIKLRP
jgi:hypothetical protein